MSQKDMVIDEGGEMLPGHAEDPLICLECEEAATAIFSWLTSQGLMRCGFCSAHAKAWWGKWAGTAAGETLRIEKLSE